MLHGMQHKGQNQGHVQNGITFLIIQEKYFC